MKTSIRFIAEHYDTETGKVLESTILRNDEIKKPVTIKDLGYLHEEQIALIQSIQDIKLHHETFLLNEDSNCPICDAKTKSNGKRESHFHAALTDHKIKIQKRHCKCGWNSRDTVERIYGSSFHPDLIEKQVIQGSENSYRQASRQLNSESKTNRKINNDDRIRRNTSKVARIIEAEKLAFREPIKQSNATKELIAVIDGGHLKSKNIDSRSFEAMISTVFCPNNIRKIDKYHTEITQKTSVASALNDNQKTIKKLLLNACLEEGCNSTVTHLTCLTDGASNCWSIAKTLKPCCKNLTMILDWFHITKRFTIINNRISDKFEKQLEKVKWFLWHGNSTDALKRLNELCSTVKEEKLVSDLKALYEYIKRNRKYIINYQERQLSNLTFTSTIAESSVNELINTRQKNNKKMQWSREGAHNILQIRASRFSKTWNKDWEKAQEVIYRKAA